MDAAVLVLNADLGPLHRVSFRHAIRMLVRQVAVVHEAEPGRIVGPWPAPKVLRLVPVRRHAVAVHRRAGLVPAGCGRPRPWPVRLLRRPRHHGRPHHAPVPRWAEHVEEHGRRVRAVQPAQG